MPSSIEALKQAVQLEEQALDQYIIAMDNAVHAETKQTLKEYADDKQQKIDTLSWVIMAESGDLEKEESVPQNGGERLAAGKCPFSKWRSGSKWALICPSPRWTMTVLNPK